MTSVELKEFSKQLRSLADNLDKISSKLDVERKYPSHCEDLYQCFKSSYGRLYIDDLVDLLGKKKTTIHTEISQLRKSGVPIKRDYIRSTGKYKFYLEQ